MAAALGEEAPDNEDYYGLLNVRREVRPRGRAGPGGAGRGEATPSCAPGGSGAPAACPPHGPGCCGCCRRRGGRARAEPRGSRLGETGERPLRPGNAGFAPNCGGLGAAEALLVQLRARRAHPRPLGHG